MGNKKTLNITHPHLVEEWDQKNTFGPNTVTFGSHKKVHWVCKKGHSWFISINARTNNNSGCPYCCGKLVSEDNRLDLKHPQIIPFWDYSKNKIPPSEISFSSHKKIYLICQLCGTSHRRSPNWLQYHKNQCSKCSNQVNEELLKYSEAKIKFKKANGKRSTRNYIAYAFKIFKSGAKVRNKTWNLTQEQVAKIITSNCRYCLRYFPEKMGIDRIDNSIGYELNNVAPCCNQCNKAKHIMSISEFKELIKLIYQNINNF